MYRAWWYGTQPSKLKNQMRDNCPEVQCPDSHDDLPAFIIQLKKIVIGEADHICRSQLAVIRWRKPHVLSQTEVSMKRLLNIGFVVVALGLLVFAKSHSPSDNRSTGSALAKNSTAVAGVSKLLPVEEFEDMSLVFSKPTKH